MGARPRLKVEAHLAIDVRPQLPPRGAGDGFSDIGHRPSSLGHPGQGLGVPVHRLLVGPLDPRGVRGYYHADGVRTPDALAKLRETAIQQGVSCFKTGFPAYYEGSRRVRRSQPRQFHAIAARVPRPGYRHRGGLSCQDQDQRRFDSGERNRAAEPAVHRGAPASLRTCRPWPGSRVAPSLPLPPGSDTFQSPEMPPVKAPSAVWPRCK